MIYKDLTVWKKSMDLVKEVYMLTKKLPKEETYGLSNHMRRRQFLFHQILLKEMEEKPILNTLVSSILLVVRNVN